MLLTLYREFTWKTFFYFHFSAPCSYDIPTRNINIKLLLCHCIEKEKRTRSITMPCRKTKSNPQDIKTNIFGNVPLLYEPSLSDEAPAFFDP